MKELTTEFLSVENLQPWHRKKDGAFCYLHGLHSGIKIVINRLATVHPLAGRNKLNATHSVSRVLTLVTQ